MNIKKQLHFSTNMGRMGNQMFQYACAKGCTKQFGAVTSLSHLDKLEYFQLSPTERIWNKMKAVLFFRVWKKVWGLSELNTELTCLTKSFIPELAAIDSPTTIWGFFQSPVYFEDCAALLKKHFEVKASYKKDLYTFFKQHDLSSGNYIAIHLRRTDYKGFTVPGLQGDDFTLPLSYYQNAIKRLGEQEELPIVFVSDAPEIIPELFPDIAAKIISVNDAITDFLILQHAAKLILSNSTFAWWAAYLNPHVAGHIYCPKYFLGFKESIEVPLSIYPSDWHQVDVL